MVTTLDVMQAYISVFLDIDGSPVTEDVITRLTELTGQPSVVSQQAIEKAIALELLYAAENNIWRTNKGVRLCEQFNINGVVPA